VWLLIILLTIPEYEWESDNKFTISSYNLEELSRLKDNPIDLNTATFAEIVRLPWISAVLAEKIIIERSQHPFRDTCDFIQRLHISKTLWEKIAPYVMVGYTRKHPTLPTKLRLSQRLRTIRGYQRTGCLGSPYEARTFLQIRYPERFAFHLLIQKDLYELHYDDFVSWGIDMRLPQVDRLFIGNYALEFGESLIFGPPYRRIKFYALKGASRLIIPYRMDGNENRTLQGIAMKHELAGISWIGFASYTMRDARIYHDTVNRIIYENLYHDTYSNITAKNRVAELLYGLYIGKNWFGFTLSTLNYWGDYEFAIPTRCKMISLMWDLPIRGGVTFYGEIGRTIWDSHGDAQVIGITYRRGKCRLTLLWRNYEDGFYAPFGNPLRGTHSSGERGLILAYTHAVRGCKFNFYIDRYLISHTQPYVDYRMTILYNFWHNYAVYVSYREKKATNDPQYYRSELRYDIRYRENTFELRTRVVRVWSSSGAGCLFYIEMGKKLAGYSISLRYTVFGANESSVAYVYQFENVAGIIRNIPLYGDGERMLLKLTLPVRSSTVHLFYVLYVRGEQFHKHELGIRWDVRI